MPKKTCYDCGFCEPGIISLDSYINFSDGTLICAIDKNKLISDELHYEVDSKICEKFMDKWELFQKRWWL
jgi:hypothetical protein